jgi:MFS family permease
MQTSNGLTAKQQTGRVAFLGVSFLTMFIAFNSLQNTVSSVYKDYGYGNLGEVSVLVLYAFFGLTTFVTPYIIRTFGYKKVMFISSLGYATYEAAGLIITIWDQMPRGLGWLIVLLGAALCGASASMIWVAQGSYVSNVAGDERKT